MGLSFAVADEQSAVLGYDADYSCFALHGAAEIRCRPVHLWRSPSSGYAGGMDRPLILFVTGKLAESALRRTLDELGARAGFTSVVVVLPITVAALATTPWIARHLAIPDGVDRLILPGLCGGDLGAISVPAGVTVERGPADLRDLPDFFRTATTTPDD